MHERSVFDLVLIILLSLESLQYFTSINDIVKNESTVQRSDHPLYKSLIPVLSQILGYLYLSSSVLSELCIIGTIQAAI